LLKYWRDKNPIANYNLIPGVVYTWPEVVDKLKSSFWSGINREVFRSKALVALEQGDLDAFCKNFADAKTGRGS
jgi:hypothetical protein